MVTYTIDKTIPNIDPSVEKISTGFHKKELSVKIPSSWKSDDSEGAEIIKKIVDEVNKLSSRIPDFDTGFFKVGIDKYYKFDHKEQFIGVPSRYAIYFSEVESPVDDKDVVHEMTSGLLLDQSTIWSNVVLNHPSENYSVLRTAPNYVYQFTLTSGYMRVLLWR